MTDSTYSKHVSRVEELLAQLAEEDCTVETAEELVAEARDHLQQARNCLEPGDGTVQLVWETDDGIETVPFNENI